MMSEFWYFVDLGGTPAGNTELQGNDLTNL